ncbi:MAG TPA: HEAT repeat domain-containing protein [Polyangiaceae bacterium]|jgi:HEAT repeat protein
MSAEDLASPDPEVRRLAAQALAEDDRPEAAALIGRALADANWRVRKEAAISAKASPRRAEILEVLLRALGDRDDVGLRNSAVEALVAIGPDAVPTAIAALKALDADGRKLAVEVLGGVPDTRGAEALAAALTDEDPNVRQSAAEALGASALAGDEARQTAVRALHSVLPRGESHAPSRTSAAPLLTLASVGALARASASLDWNLLAPYLADPLLRGSVLAVCGRCPDPACGEALADALFDPNLAHARVAMTSLAEWIHAAMQRGAAIDAIAGKLQARDAGARVHAIDEGTPQSRGAALTLLAILGDAEAAPAIVRALLDPMLARSAEAAVSMLGAAALPALLAVGEREPPSRHAALLLVVPTLAGQLDERALAVIRATLGHAESDVAAAAAQVLGAVGEGSDIERLALFATSENAPRSAALAIEALAERHPDEARAAFQRLAGDPSKTLAGCVLLAALRGAPPGSVEYLERAIGDDDPRARRAAIDAIAMIDGDTARERVAAALADEDRDVQLAAIRALGVLRHGPALSTLLASVSDPEIVAAAVSALSEADASAALEVCARLATREDPAIASAAVTALGRLGPRGEEGLFRALDHPSDEIVRLALSELGRAPSEHAIERVAGCLEHASWEVRRLAAEVLGEAGGERAMALLRARLERENETAVREAIMFALAGPSLFPVGGAEPT